MAKHFFTQLGPTLLLIKTKSKTGSKNMAKLMFLIWYEKNSTVSKKKLCWTIFREFFALECIDFKLLFTVVKLLDIYPSKHKHTINFQKYFLSLTSEKVNLPVPKF